MARPPREEAPPSSDGVYERNFFFDARGRGRHLKKVRNLGRPRPLLVAIDRASYKPIAQASFDAELNLAVGRLPGLMEAELVDAINHMAERGRARGGAR